MPDDYFYHHPKYAAGDEMDNIRTGRNVGGGGPHPILILSIVIAVATVLLAFSGVRIGLPMTGEVLGANPMPIVGEPDLEITEMTFDSQQNKVTIVVNLTNGTNKAIYNNMLSYQVMDENGEEVGWKIITLEDALEPEESITHYEIIQLEKKPQGSLRSTVTGQYTYKTLVH